MGARSQSASGTGPCALSIVVALEKCFTELSLDAKKQETFSDLLPLTLKNKDTFLYVC